MQTIETYAKRFCQRLCHHGLANAGDIFQQDMALRQEAEDRETDFVALAEDHLSDGLHNALGNRLDKADDIILHIGRDTGSTFICCAISHVWVRLCFLSCGHYSRTLG